MTTVLVVDDLPDVRLSFMFMLEASGYDVAEASDGAAALAYMQNHQVDVVLTDLYMPGMDGVALIRALMQKHPHRPRIIVMSGAEHLGRNATMQAATVAGADVILSKPITREQLLRAIRGM
jgi:two-component system, chemotaxis family, chemotaxis protein CheY